MTAIGIVLGFIGLILLICGLALILQKRSYALCSEPVRATVIYKHAHSAKSGKIYELQVSYTVDGIEYKKNIRTSLSDYNVQSEGSRIDLLYKSGSPKKAVRPQDAKDAKSSMGLTIAGAVLTAAGVVLVIVGQL